MKLYKAAFQRIAQAYEHPKTLALDVSTNPHMKETRLSAAAEQLLQEFQRLPLGPKAAMALVIVEKWSIDETAEIMDTSPERIRENLLEARRRISPDLWRRDYIPE